MVISLSQCSELEFLKELWAGQVCLTLHTPIVIARCTGGKKVAVITWFAVCGSIRSSWPALLMVEPTFKSILTKTPTSFLCSGHCLNGQHSNYKFSSIRPLFVELALWLNFILLHIFVLARCSSAFLSSMCWQAGVLVPGRPGRGEYRTNGSFMSCTPTIKWSTWELKILSTAKLPSSKVSGLLPWTLPSSRALTKLLLLCRLYWTRQILWTKA